MTVCRACKRENLNLFLPLGNHPPANAFLRADQLATPEPMYPLNTYVCRDCGLVEVPDQIPADFFRNYLYVPSASPTMHAHFAELARTLRQRCCGGTDALAVDIGSNDGVLLKALADLGGSAVGVEPAANLTTIARAKGLEVVNDFFHAATARAMLERYGPASAIVTTNTFNHIDDLHGFVEAVSILLAPEGLFVIEVPQALEYVRQHEFDTVYHEHLSTFSVKSLVDLFRFFDMQVVDISELPIHGGSMRVFVRKTNGRPEPAVAREWVTREEEAGLFLDATYQKFAQTVDLNRARVIEFLHELKRRGQRVVGYGAPAKGNTLLNYFQIGPELLDYLADRNPLKHGLYSPGMHIPIVPAEQILKDQPDYCFILAWNFADEIVAQLVEYRQRGGKFVIPIPKLRILD